MRNRFDEQLRQLNSDLARMGALCEEAIEIAAKALIEGDPDIGEKALKFDREIDELEREIEDLCLRLLLQQQPVARDLRLISAALKMITDMERIGDQATDIVEIIPDLGGRTGGECASIQAMSRATIRMVVESVDAFINRDLELARSVIKYDDVVDDYFASVKKNLIKMIEKDSTDGEYALDLLMIAKYFERIGDHATNVAEWVEFAITGSHEGEEE